MHTIFVFYLFIIFLFQNVHSQPRCSTSYFDYAIKGNDIQSTSGRASSCCQACQNLIGCQAYSWDNSNGGTCWLKNDTQPLIKSSGAFAGMTSRDSDHTYSLNMTYDASNFWNDTFMFVHWADASHGFVNYTDQKTAEHAGLIGVQNGKVYIAVDNTSILEPNSTRGRNSIRIESWHRFDSGLFIFSIDHMPTGNGTWPAYWTYGTNWPDDGEIDILEGIYTFDHNQITLHTRNHCEMQVNDSIYFSGTWVDQNNLPGTNCYIYAPGQYNGAGCSIAAAKDTFNTGFNQAGGGVFAMEWEREKFIRIWNFVKPNIPVDIVNESPNPDPSTWGFPTAYFTIGSNCTSNHFNNHTIVINTDMCGWAGTVMKGGETECKDIVRNHPEAFSESYWLINYVKVFCKPGDTCRSH